MKKLLPLLFVLLPTLAYPSGIFNPGSGTGGGGGGGASALEVLFGTARSSPTATIKATSSDFTGAVSGSTITLTMSPTQSTINTFTSSVTVNNTAGLKVATVVNASSANFTAANVTATSMTVTGAGGFKTVDSPSSFNSTSLTGTAIGLASNANNLSATTQYGLQSVATGNLGSPNTSIALYGCASGSNVNHALRVDAGCGDVDIQTLSASLPVQTNASKVLTSAAIDLSGTQATGTMAAARMPALTGDVTTSAGAVATTAAATQANIKTFTSSITVTNTNGIYSAGPLTVSSNTVMSGATFYQNAPATISSVTVSNQFKTLGSLYISTGPVVRSTYTLTTADSVILASAAPNGNITIQLPSAASIGGQFYAISKIDRSTGSVTVQVNGTDLIANTTGTMVLNAPGQSLTLISDGVSAWAPIGSVPATSSFIGDTADPNGGTALAVANDVRCQAYTNTDFAIGTGVRFSVAVQSGNMDVGIYDNKGVRLASTGSSVVPAAPAAAGFTFTGKAYMAPGPIWICLAADNTTATFRAPSSTDLVGSCEIASSFPLPATLTFVGCPAASKRFAIVATIQGGPQS